MYVSTQDTQSVLLYDAIGNPVANGSGNGLNGDYPGAIVTYGEYNENGDGVRGIAIDNINGLLFVAEENFNVVLVYDINNKFKNVYNITNGKSSFKPIAIEYNSDYFESIVFVGDDDKDLVYAFKVTRDGYSIFWTSESNDNLDHPAGIAVSNDVLYVVSQNAGRIVRYDPSNGNYEKTIVNFKHVIGDDPTGELLIYVRNDSCFSQ